MSIRLFDSSDDAEPDWDLNIKASGEIEVIRTEVPTSGIPGPVQMILQIRVSEIPKEFWDELKPDSRTNLLIPRRVLIVVLPKDDTQP